MEIARLYYVASSWETLISNRIPTDALDEPVLRTFQQIVEKISCSFVEARYVACTMLPLAGARYVALRCLSLGQDMLLVLHCLSLRQDMLLLLCCLWLRQDIYIYIAYMLLVLCCLSYLIACRCWAVEALKACVRNPWEPISQHCSALEWYLQMGSYIVEDFFNWSVMN